MVQGRLLRKLLRVTPNEYSNEENQRDKGNTYHSCGATYLENIPQVSSESLESVEYFIQVSNQGKHTEEVNAISSWTFETDKKTRTTNKKFGHQVYIKIRLTVYYQRRTDQKSPTEG
ncbi:hypothetical protein LCGC14_1570290 [marine sediment metagenome]|uniref:Uncharacterized protein n=1 Tax=marine sediment metagenome TaxID=412755 RepID=A0A0F9J664_9ZZZZ